MERFKERGEREKGGVQGGRGRNEEVGMENMREMEMGQSGNEGDGEEKGNERMIVVREEDSSDSARCVA